MCRPVQTIAWDAESLLKLLGLDFGAKLEPQRPNFVGSDECAETGRGTTVAGLSASSVPGRACSWRTCGRISFES